MRRIFEIGDEEVEVWLSHDGSGYTLHEGDRAIRCALRPTDEKGGYVLDLDGRRVALRLAQRNGVAFIHLGGRTYEVGRSEPADRLMDGGGDKGSDRVIAPMPGVVVSVAVAVGDRVSEGDPLLVIESMKLETTLAAPRDGIVAEVAFGPGDSFGLKALLVQLAAKEG